MQDNWLKGNITEKKQVYWRAQREIFFQNSVSPPQFWSTWTVPPPPRSGHPPPRDVFGTFPKGSQVWQGGGKAGGQGGLDFFPSLTIFIFLRLPQSYYFLIAVELQLCKPYLCNKYFEIPIFQCQACPD